jgi:2-dehydropantoate 2-reductase
LTFTQIIILGAGAIGSTYGGVLSRTHNVILIARPKHVAAIKSKGLVLEGEYAGTYNPETATKLKEIKPDTLLLVCTKAVDLSTALTPIQSLIRNDTVVLLLQNGLSILDQVKTLLRGKGTVVRGLTTIAAEILAPGRVKTWRGDTILNTSTTAKRIAQILEENKMSVRTTNDLTQQVWKKLILNCVVNPLTAILRVPNNAISAPQLKGIRHAIITECLTVAAAEGVSLENDMKVKIDRTLAEYTNRSSMLQDILRGRQTEIDYINGKIVALGTQHNIATPVNKALTQIIRFLEDHSIEH